MKHFYWLEPNIKKYKNSTGLIKNIKMLLGIILDTCMCIYTHTHIFINYVVHLKYNVLCQLYLY